MMTIQNLEQDAINRLLADTVYAVIERKLKESQPGHCLRISTLPETVMRDLCARFNSNGYQADVILLAAPHQASEASWHITSTRLIELRNTAEQPLLAFIPPGLRAAAEDSFDISTFGEIDLRAVPTSMRQQLRDLLPEPLQPLTDRIVDYLEKKERIITANEIVRYYLTIQHNGSTEEAAGGALFQLNLMPDFTLLSQKDRIEARLSRNIAALQTLKESKQPLLGRIHELKLKPDTLQSDLYTFLRAQPLDRPAQWGAIIATDPAYHPLAFDQWRLEGEEVDRELILLYVDDLDLPKRDEKQPAGIDNPRYLDVKRTTNVKIKWETNPKPAAVSELKAFRIEVVSSDGAVIWESKNIAPGTSTRSSRSKTIKVADFRDRVEEAGDGLYFFRMRAYSETGEIINEEDSEEHPEILRDQRNPEGKRINESEDVWFWVDPTGEPPPAEPQRNLTVSSFLHAQVHVQCAALDRGEDPFSTALTPLAEKTGWATIKEKRAEATYHIIFDAQARFTLPVSNLLRKIEAETLAQPEMLGRWRLSFDGTNRTFDTVQPMPRQFHRAANILDAFIDARRSVFQAIRQGNQNRDAITATVNLLDHEQLILAYAGAYQTWLSQVQANFDTLAIREENGRRRTDPIFLDLDIVELVLPGEDGHRNKVYLLAPTHPLRLLWHLQQARMAQTWIETAVDSGQPHEVLSPAVRAYLQQSQTPINLPPLIRAAHEGYPEAPMHFYVEHGALTPFWSLYIRQDVDDNRGIRAQVQKLLGLGRSSSAIEVAQGIDDSELTAKLFRYLVQHPYVHTLKLNVFNPGDAGLVVDAILGLEKKLSDKTAHVRYELRLFTRTDLDDVGSAVDELLNPERQVIPEADAFTVPSRNHLFPKLRFSRNALSDFLRMPEQYEAHISILHDLFPVGVSIETARQGRSSFVYGLIQEQVTQFAGDETHYAWQRQLLPNHCQELSGDSFKVSANMATLLGQIANLQASVHAGRPLLEAIPTLQLKLGDKGLLFQIHQVSDWVFLIDRHLGLDYFDSDVGDERPVYLLDFTPEFGSGDTDRLLLTTRAVDEVTQLIQPHLDKYDLLIGQGIELYFLHLLRSLSGRLALKLLATPNSVSEVLGLAAARLFLEQYGLLTERIIIPLDAHSALFSGADQNLAEEISIQRGDLLLVTCAPETRTLHFHIIEVKWRADLGDLSAFVALQQHIESQLTHSEETLRWHFDPNLTERDRIDRQIKTRALIELLTFYLERSRRYGVISEQVLPTLRTFLESLDMGYRLTCAGAGLIFDFGYTGVHSQEEHAGLVFHRVGQDYIRTLLANGLTRRTRLQEQRADKPITIEAAEQQAAERQRIVRDTSMSGDASYQRVRTHFQLPGQIKSVENGDEPQVDTEEPTAGEDISGTPVPDHAAATDEHTPAPDTSAPNETQASTVSDASTGDAIALEHAPPYDILLGDTGTSRQYGILGQTAGKRVALDLNGTNTISLFGVQGGGKSYTVGSIVEMATRAFDGINTLPSPLASVIFHYHESQDYAPEFVSMSRPNSKDTEIRLLAEEYGAHPAQLDDVLILTSADKLAARQAEFPSVHVEPLSFASSELSVKDWRFLMGVFGDQMYMKQINLIMRELRDQLTLEALSASVEESDLSDGQKRIVRNRLTFAAQFINDARYLADVLQPGRLIIVDLRDEFIEKEEALGLFVVMLNIFANAGRDAGFNKLIVFDEAHKYMDNPSLTRHIVDVIRQMRHQGVSILIASQDPPSLPNEIIELSSLVILHRFNSPQWVKHVQRSVTALSDLTPAQMSILRPGEAYIWSNKTTEPVFTQKAQKVRFRPRVTQHGGGTKMAVE